MIPSFVFQLLAIGEAILMRLSSQLVTQLLRSPEPKRKLDFKRHIKSIHIVGWTENVRMMVVISSQAQGTIFMTQELACFTYFTSIVVRITCTTRLTVKIKLNTLVVVTDSSDTRFRYTYENVYGKSSNRYNIKNLDFWHVAGNHDHKWQSNIISKLTAQHNHK